MLLPTGQKIRFPRILPSRTIVETRLFGWNACDKPAADIIKVTYDDFYKLSHVDGLWQNFDWDGQAAKEMWGAPSKIPDERREEIRRKVPVSTSMQQSVELLTWRTRNLRCG